MVPFYTYTQNNSGGEFDFDAKRGISAHVIIEANDAAAADDIAEKIGLYFDGCDSGRDCSCCGDRWSALARWRWSAEGDAVPSVYGEPVGIGEPFVEGCLNVKWLTPMGYVHFADDRIEAFGL